MPAFSSLLNRLSLSGKFTLLISGLLTAFCLTITVVATETEGRMISRRLVSKARSFSSLLAATAPNHILNLDIKHLRLTLADVVSQDEVLYAYVLDDAGRVLTDGTNENAHRNEAMSDPISVNASRSTGELLQWSEHVLDITQPAYLGGKKLGAVRLGLSTERVRQTTASIRSRNLFIGSCFLLTGFVLTLVAVRSITLPLRTLMEGTRAVGRGDFNCSLNVHEGRADELGTLCAGFNEMLRQIRNRDADLNHLHEQLVATAHSAGMAEVATNVLHNVGNVLNSVNVSAALIGEQIRQSRLTHLQSVVDLLNSRANDLGVFVTTDAKGKLLPAFLEKLVEQLRSEQDRIAEELRTLSGNVGHINDIVRMQQSYAGISSMTDSCRIDVLFDDAMQFAGGAVSKHGVRIVREFEADLPEIDVEKSKLLQILVNLIKNAADALAEVDIPDRVITLSARREGDERVRLAVADNGPGIAEEHLTKIFVHGFTTKPQGHGFGLHGASIAAAEMGGALSVASPGPSRGATFALELPLHRDMAAAL